MNNESASATLDEYLVAVIDILGIKSAIYNSNDACLKSMSAAFIDAMHNGKNNLADELIKRLTDDVRKQFLELYNKTIAWVFSDTIVMTLNLDKIHTDLDTDSAQIAISLFFNQVVMMFYNLFCMGFPSRCCINMGRLVIRENFVFGSAYVNALMISDSLDFSGIVVPCEVYGKIKNIYLNSPSNINGCKIVVPLSKPLEGKNEKTFWCIDWISHIKNPLRIAIENSSQWFYDMFSMFNKQITCSVERKIKNTERTLRQIASLTTLPDHLAVSTSPHEH